MKTLLAPVEPARAAVTVQPGAPLEIVSTCQLKVAGGSSIAVVALRAAGAPPCEGPLCHLCLLPANGAAGEPSSYNLRTIALQADFRSLRLVSADREIVYFLSGSGSEPHPVIVDRGEPFDVPAWDSPDGTTDVVLTFEGDYCLIDARSVWAAVQRSTDHSHPPPPPLP